MKIGVAFLAAALSVAANFVVAQVEIVDRPVGTSTRSGTVHTNSSAPSSGGDAQAASNSAELFYQIQVLQQELLDLRGLVEQQAHQIKQLKQQRLDDYVDLDRRIGDLNRKNLSTSNTQSTANNTSSSVADQTNNATITTSSLSSSVSSSANEIAHYKSATKLILVDKDYDAGILRLNEHLELYPRGRYRGNVQYWLGEVYLAKADLDTSKQWFERLLKESPAHTKAPDSKYKLGTIFHKLGADAEAKQLLNEVSSGHGNAAKLASQYLKANF